MFNILYTLLLLCKFTCTSFFKGDVISVVNTFTTSKEFIFLFITLLLSMYGPRFTFTAAFLYMFSTGNLFYSQITNSFNIGLNNSLSVSHPLLLLFSIFFIYILCTTDTSLFFRFRLRKGIFLLAFSSLISMLLGSLWSEQEVFWDGFWNWDYIELSIFYFWIHYLLSSHLKSSNITILASSFFVLGFLKFGTITPFLSSVHSFSGAPLMFFSLSNSPFYFFFLTLFLFFIFKRSFLFFKSILLFYFFFNYSLEFENTKNISNIRNSLYTFLFMFIFSNRKLPYYLYSYYNVCSISFSLYTLTHITSYLFLLCYFQFFSKSIFISQNMVYILKSTKLSSFGGYKTVFLIGLEDLFNIYFSLNIFNGWTLVAPTLDYSTNFTN